MGVQIEICCELAVTVRLAGAAGEPAAGSSSGPSALPGDARRGRWAEPWPASGGLSAALPRTDTGGWLPESVRVRQRGAGGPAAAGCAC